MEEKEMVTMDRLPTDEERIRILEWLAVHPYGDQDENGIDLGAIRRNLKLTPTERLRRLESAARALRRFRYVENSK